MMCWSSVPVQPHPVHVRCHLLKWDLWLGLQTHSHSGGRPTGTTASEGYDVSHSGGRPRGTTASEGYGVFHSGGRPKISLLMTILVYQVNGMFQQSILVLNCWLHVASV